MEIVQESAGSFSTPERTFVTGAQLPLAMVAEGQTVSVLKVRGNPQLKQHLSELGFVPGAQVQMVSRVNGDVVVCVKGANFGIGRDMAMRIVTE